MEFNNVVRSNNVTGQFITKIDTLIIGQEGRRPIDAILVLELFQHAIIVNK